MPLRVWQPQPRPQAAQWGRPGVGAHPHHMNSLWGGALGKFWQPAGSGALAAPVWRQAAGVRRRQVHRV